MYQPGEAAEGIGGAPVGGRAQARVCSLAAASAVSASLNLDECTNLETSPRTRQPQGISITLDNRDQMKPQHLCRPLLLVLVPVLSVVFIRIGQGGSKLYQSAEGRPNGK